MTVTQELTAGTAAATQDEHKLTVTVTTPAWNDNDEYYLLSLTIVVSMATIDLLGAVANYPSDCNPPSLPPFLVFKMAGCQ